MNMPFLGVAMGVDFWGFKGLGETVRRGRVPLRMVYVVMC